MLTYAIQKVGYDFDRTDLQGSTDLAGFLTVIDGFPWAQQQRAWDADQEGPMPQLVLENADDQRQLWITALGTAGAGEAFQLQSVSSQMRKSLFGKPKLQRDVTVFDVHERRTLDQLCTLFCEGSYEALDREAQRLESLSGDED
ncbi:hypothetical protein G7047_24210 [Diaphorobacter sp. HDW4A]|uniref:hypothetical protein n=1 Tax=Diaphorobacter sp. HDW4A TaxID=2714924 RepID=UPI00140AC75C|nr:hypothetical protein [Diaphorobacter sp. HDW4A]QIL82692.1 hypothetical protein G7047_24210 [Diaphorobacter sp. HDW4A]